LATSALSLLFPYTTLFRSPEHFYQSNDEGTVAVRYIVQALTPSGTRLRIDAVFVEASLRRRHASDGQVENSEFEAVSAKMQDIEDRKSTRLNSSHEWISYA